MHPTLSVRLLLPVMLLLSLPAAGRGRQEAGRTGMDAAVSGAYTNSGVHLSLQPVFRYRRHRITLGAKILVDENYIPHRSIWGIDAGYRYVVLQGRRFSATADMDYLHGFYRFGSEPGSGAGGDKNARISELYAGLGLFWQVREGSRISVFLKTASGILLDNYYNAAEGRNRTDTYRSAMLRLGINCNLYDRK